MFMKILPGLIMLVASVSPNVAATQSTPGVNERLRYYHGKSVNEQEIVKVILDYQKAYNSYDPIGVLAVYLPGAIIKAGVKDDWSEHFVTKEEYAGIVADMLSKRKMYSFILELFEPKGINVEGNTAELIIPFITYSTSEDYWERGVFDLECRKTDSGWLISKNTWKVLDLFYNP
jgi:hypothetical protein